jgi:uncharacterized protein (DUF2235 family)
MSKVIIFCADGTWNGPDHDDDGDRQPDPTNVYKLFRQLAGALSENSSLQADEQEKELLGQGGLLQVGKYIHGVGDAKNIINKILGGAFGSGTIKRIVRGYTFISRNYELGDAIFITGFSRGAYTARALAGLITSQGVLAQKLTTDPEAAYRAGAQAWYRYRAASGKSAGFFDRLIEAMADLPAFVSSNKLTDHDFVPVEKIKAVAVWDTVGALGVPLYIDDARADTFKFTNNKLSPKVEHGFHAVALDEQREDFTPTLWDKANNVTEMLFPGAHADVGGGYTAKNGESGLSDIALDWMIKQLQTVGVAFRPDADPLFAPNPHGTAHRPWHCPPFNLVEKTSSRAFVKATGIQIHPAIGLRMDLPGVIHEPGTAAAPYKPGNLPK